MAIFSQVHQVLPLSYVALFPQKMQRHSSTGIAPALLPDPDPPAPTPAGGTYEILGWRVWEAICRKRDVFFLMDTMFTHLFPSWLTNGLIIQLSPWNVI